MKYLLTLFLMPLIFSACDSSPEDISSLFRASGVDLEIESEDTCINEQLDILFDQIGESKNKEELLNLLGDKKITKLSVKAKKEFPIECNQAIIDLNSPVALRVCDPGTYSHIPKDLMLTQINIADGEILLQVNTQELTKHFYVYATDILLKSELSDFEIQVQKMYKKRSYLSFDAISDLSTQYGLTIKKLSHFSENNCGGFISLKDLMLRLSL